MKKNNFFLNFNWTSIDVRCILYALFILQFFSLTAAENTALNKKEKVLVDLEAELEVLKKENSILRKELADVLLKYQKLEEDKLRFELGLISLLEDGEQIPISERELQLFRDLLEIKKAYENVSSKLKTLLGEVGKIVEKEGVIEVSAVDKVRLKLVSDELQSQMEDLSCLLQSVEENPKPDKCTILEIDDKKGIVVLSGGRINGFFCGLRLYGGKKNEIVLQVIAVRQYVSAGLLIEGRIKDLVPGMEFRAYKKDE